MITAAPPKRRFTGLTHDGVYLCYGVNHGLRLPLRLQRLLVRAWNGTLCRVSGHEDALWHLWDAGEIADPQCAHCCASLNACTGKGIAHR